jgi:CRISPR/Cas system CSM-associated protein Csm3 (group 7 of RAMP superfamily)
MMETKKFEDYPLRYIAQITLEAVTPLAIASGENDILTDSVILKDANGLPVIPGSSLAGVLREAFGALDKEGEKQIFGFQDQQNQQEGRGSRLIFSDGVFVGKQGHAIEGLASIDWEDEFYTRFQTLPIRQHVKISHTGGSDPKARGKFDEQVVYAGTRFKCEIELVGNQKDAGQWEKIRQIFGDAQLRVGGGTRRGFGRLAVRSWLDNIFDLKDPEQRRTFLKKTSSLNDDSGLELRSASTKKNLEWVEYRIELSPENFWYFGSGFGDDQTDMTPVSEARIVWQDSGPVFTPQKILIPASAVKGAISHRVAFHYNLLSGVFADQTDSIEKHVSGNNNAVKELFGCTLSEEDNFIEPVKTLALRGNVLFSDLYMDAPATKILNHVSIDRFTGGSRDGALFDERVISNATSFPCMKIFVKKAVLLDEKIKSALEKTLDDLTRGFLPLGGGAMRGHGAFTGTWRLNHADC